VERTQLGVVFARHPKRKYVDVNNIDYPERQSIFFVRFPFFSDGLYGYHSRLRTAPQHDYRVAKFLSARLGWCYNPKNFLENGKICQPKQESVIWLTCITVVQ